MNNSVSLTIPIEPGALCAAITMLTQLKDGCNAPAVVNHLSNEEVENLRKDRPLGLQSIPLEQAHDPYDYVARNGYDSTANEKHETEQEATASWDAVNSDPYAQVGAINPSVAFGGVPPPPPPENQRSAQNTDTEVDLDSEGMPWDARIHTAARSKVANGTWKLARNIDRELVKTVKAEYMGNAGSTPTQNAGATAKPAADPMSNAAVPPPPGDVGLPPVTGAHPLGMSYEQAIDYLITEKKIPVAIIQQRCTANGLPTFALLQDASNAYLIPIIVAEAVEANEKRLLTAGMSNA